MTNEKAIEILEGFEDGYKVQFYSGQQVTIKFTDVEREAVRLAVERIELTRHLETLVDSIKAERDRLKQIAEEQNKRTDQIIENMKSSRDYMPNHAKTSYREGAEYAFYELCKELDVRSEDIRKSGDTIDGIAARLAERILQELRSEINM